MKKLLVLLGLATMSATLMCACEGKTGKDAGEYEIVVESTEGGHAVASRTRADAEETITLTAAPNSGVEFAGWKVLEGVAVFADPMALETTFTMPAINVKIQALFSEPTEAGVTFRGLTWATRNVGAPGKFAAPGDWGMVYQFNRMTGWSLTDPVTSIPVGQRWKGISDETYPTIWAEENNPCPEGWRIPTRQEFVHMAGFLIDGANMTRRPKYNAAREEVPEFVYNPETKENDLPNPAGTYDVTYEFDAELARDSKVIIFTDTATGDKMTMSVNGMVSNQDPTKPQAMWMNTGAGYYVSATYTDRGNNAAYSFGFTRDTANAAIARVNPASFMPECNAYGIRCVKK